MKSMSPGWGRSLALLAAVGLVALMTTGDAQALKRKKYKWTDEFPIASCSNLVTSTADGAHNQYWILEIGRVWNLSTQPCIDRGDCDADELLDVDITVLNQTEMVDGVETRVVEAKEYENGDLVETSQNFYVECADTGDVFYFGEDVEDGDGNPLPDGWRAGVNGAKPGLIFPGGTFQIGARYYQELAPGVALDRAEHAAMGFDFSVAAGDFSDCVLVWDDNAIENPKSKKKNLEDKVYCPGIGFVLDEEAELVSYVDP